MDFLPCLAATLIIFLWIYGKLVMSVSIPKSPRATITPSEFFTISSRFESPSWSSTFTKVSTFSDLFLRNFLSVSKSCFERQNERAIKSTPISNAKSKSFLSLSVSVGSLIFAPGKLTCFFPAITPLSKTSQVILLDRSIFLIFNSMAPLSREIFPPFLMPLTYFRLSTGKVLSFLPFF